MTKNYYIFLMEVSKKKNIFNDVFMNAYQENKSIIIIKKKKNTLLTSK